jgi:hypothetical protein
MPRCFKHLADPEPFFRITVANRDYHQLSRFEIGGAKRIYQHLSRTGAPRSP